MGSYPLSPATIASVQANYDKGAYAAGYRAIRDDLVAQNTAAQQAGLPLPVDRDTIAWYTNAPEINDPNSTSFIHYFARDYVSSYAQRTVGHAVDDATFQKCIEQSSRQTTP